MLAGLGQAVVLGNLRCYVHLAQRRNVIVGVVGFVLADRDSSSRSFGFLLEHRLGGTSLGGAAGLRDGAVNSKTVAVLHDRMTHIAELGLAPGRFAIEGPAGRLCFDACRSCAFGRESSSRRR